MSDEPKPCPFCDEVPPVSKADGMTPMVGHACRVLDLQITVPLHVWSTRAERKCTYDRAEDYSLVCSACGWNRRGALIIPNYCPHCGARVENANEDELAATHHRFQVVSE